MTSASREPARIVGYLLAAGCGLVAGSAVSVAWMKASYDLEGSTDADTEASRVSTERAASTTTCPKAECPSPAPRMPNASNTRLSLDLCLASLQGERSESSFVLGEGQRPSEALDADVFEKNGESILDRCIGDHAEFIAADCQSIPCSVSFTVQEGREPDLIEVLEFADCARDNFKVADAATRMESLVQMSVVECPDGSRERYFTAMAAAAEELPQELGGAYRVLSTHHLLRVYEAACPGAELIVTE